MMILLRSTPNRMGFLSRKCPEFFAHLVWLSGARTGLGGDSTSHLLVLPQNAFERIVIWYVLIGALVHSSRPANQRNLGGPG
jgi:hypothetical protein